MNKRTLTALHGSIRKWIRIVEWKDEDKGSDNCPLCKAFLKHNRHYSKVCDGCPVFKKTGYPSCEQTPFESWCDYQDEGRIQGWEEVSIDERRVFNFKTQIAAENEALFLISLLPESEQKRYFK